MSNDMLKQVGNEPVSDGYLEKRRLGKRARANWWLLWLVGVGGVIYGHFAGWNAGLAVGGFWGMLWANLLVALMYAGIVFSVAELSTALPHAGGFYSYVRYAFGPLVGFVCGVLVTIQYIFLAAVSVGLLAHFLAVTFSQSATLWAFLLYVIFTGLNIGGTKLTFRVAAFFAVLSTATLMAFCLVVLYTDSFQIDLLFNIQANTEQSDTWLAEGWREMFALLPFAGGVKLSLEQISFAALPFAILFYLPLEQISFMAEELHQPTQEIPAALKSGFATLFCLSFLALLFISGSGDGALAVSRSLTPVPETLAIMFGGYQPYFTLMTMMGLFASALLFINTSGRIIFALSRAGYLPVQLSLTDNYQTPIRALVLAAAVGWLCFYLFYLLAFGDSADGLLYLARMAIFSAILSYLLVMGSYVQLKREHPELPRPYISPLSDRGAMVAFAIAFIILLLFLIQPDFRVGLYTIGLIILLAVLYFIFSASHRLVLDAPEEKEAQLAKTKPMVVGTQMLKRVVLLVVVLLSVRLTIILSGLGASCLPDCSGETMIREDFADADLSRAKFIEAKMLESNFEEANLSNADLSGANLVNASLAKANLSGAKLMGANLSGADLGGAIFENTDMRGANLSETKLTNVDLTSARLDGIQLQKADLTGANLWRVNLAGVELTSAQMKRIDLSGANLAGSTLSGADLSGAQLNGSDLAGAWLNMSILTGADLSQANLSGANLIGATLTSVNLSDSEMIGSTIIGATFSGADLRGANLTEAHFQKKEWNEQDLLDDPVLKELNEHQKEMIIKTADLSSIESNYETAWPNSLFFSSNPIKVGVLYSLTGPMAIIEHSMHQATLLAIDEINAAGGVLGRPLEPIIEDGASDEVLFVQKARTLLREHDVAVIFGGSRHAQHLTPILAGLNNRFLFSPTSSSGFEYSPYVFYIGSDPAQQIVPAVRYLLDEGHENIFLLASADAYGHKANRIVEAMLADKAAKVVGEESVPLEDEAHDFTDIIRQIEETEASAIFNTMAGASNVAFFQQLKQAGISAEEVAVMSVSVSEQEIAAIGAENIAGHVTSSSYYQNDASDDINAFVESYLAEYSQEHVTSAPVHTSYAAVYLWSELLNTANSTNFDTIRETVLSQQIEYAAPGGLMRLDGKTGHTYQPSRIGLIRADGLIEELSSTEEPIKPDPFLSQYEWGEALLESIEGE